MQKQKGTEKRRNYIVGLPHAVSYPIHLITLPPIVILSI